MKIYGAIRTALYWALTALVFVFISTLAEIEVLRYFIGGLMIFYGVEEIILTAFKNKKHYSVNSLYWNIVEIVIGLTLIVFVETGDIEVTYAVVCVSWAIWSILRETRELVEATEKLKESKLIACKVVAIFNILESLTVIGFSLTMLIEPGEHHATIHLYILTVELLTKVLYPIIDYIAEHSDKKKKAKLEQTEVDSPQPEVTDDGVTDVVADGVPASDGEQQNTEITQEELMI